MTVTPQPTTPELSSLTIVPPTPPVPALTYRFGSCPRPGFTSPREAVLEAASLFLSDGFTGDRIRAGIHPGDDLLAQLADAIDALYAEGLDAAAAREIVFGPDAGEPDPYCSVCGAAIGIFRARGDGWQHWRWNDGGAAEIYDAGHAPVVAWRGEGPR